MRPPTDSSSWRSRRSHAERRRPSLRSHPHAIASSEQPSFSLSSARRPSSQSWPGAALPASWSRIFPKSVIHQVRPKSSSTTVIGHVWPVQSASGRSLKYRQIVSLVLADRQSSAGRSSVGGYNLGGAHLSKSPCRAGHRRSAERHSHRRGQRRATSGKEHRGTPPRSRSPRRCREEPRSAVGAQRRAL